MKYLLLAFGLLFLPVIGFGQVTDTLPTDSDWGFRPDNMPAHSQEPGFIGRGGQRVRDSVRVAFVTYRKLRHEFGDFYSDGNKQWYVLSTSFGRWPGKERYIIVACPRMDEASFRKHFPYWQDKNGVYYARLRHPSQSVFLIPAADPATFHALGFENLAVDKRRVFQSGRVVPGLAPGGLRVYTPGGQREGLSDVNSSTAYLVSGEVGYRPGGQRLSVAEAAHFQVPPDYKLAYPSPAATKPKTLKSPSSKR